MFSLEWWRIQWVWSGTPAIGVQKAAIVILLFRTNTILRSRKAGSSTYIGAGSVFGKLNDWTMYRPSASGAGSGKSRTSRVESNNEDTRHWFAHFQRKARIVFQSAFIVSLTLKLQTFRRLLFNN